MSIIRHIDGPGYFVEEDTRREIWRADVFAPGLSRAFVWETGDANARSKTLAALDHDTQHGVWKALKPMIAALREAWHD